jgi:amino acid adenylation domain-containing protein
MELKNRLESDTGVSVPLGLLLDGVSPRALSGELSRGTAIDRSPLPEIEGTDHPLSHGQRSLWLAHRMAPGSPVYNLALAARVEMDAERLRLALDRLASRHAVLRTTYPLVNGEPVQRIGEGGVDFAVLELAPGRIEEEAWRPFDLENGPVMRARLFVTPGERPVLMLAVHHIAADFWSLGLMLDEVAESGRPLPVPPPLRGRGRPLPLPYAAWARWQRERLEGETGERLWGEWREVLAGAPAVLDLPSDRPRPPVPSHCGGSHGFSLGPELSGRVRALASASGATVYSVLLAAFAALLHRHTGREDLLVGSAAAGRTRPGLEGVAGHFVNLVPVRADLSGDPAFSELVARTRRAVARALELQDLPFPVLVERLDPARDPSRHPLVQVAFALEQPHPSQSGAAASFVLGRAGSPVKVGDLVLEPIDLPRRATPFDLTLLAVETGGTIEAALEYSADLFDAETAERLAGRFLTLLDAAVADPSLRLSDLPVLDERERGLLLAWSDGPADEVPGGCAHELFEEQVDRAPDAPAVVDSDGLSWTYRELEARANRLARHLQSMGVVPETPVALLLGRSPEMVQAMLGVQKAGGFYVPVDPAHPAERIDLMLADCGARVVVTGEMLASLPIPDTSGRPAGGAGPDNPAYALYTSGSTGRPKAVVVPHRSLAGLVRHAAAEFRLGPGARALQVAAPAFDASVVEIFTALTSGAALCLASEEARLSGPRLAAEIRERGATFAILTPSALRFLPEEDLPLRTLAVGGEALPGPLAERWSGRLRLLNCYGPAEATVYVASHLCRPGEGPPPIGRPIANTRLRVLGPWSSEPLPVGVPGELCVGGLPPARGYLGRPGLTAERWVPDSFGEGRLYRTGDLVRWRPDGELEFLGRIDTQVKIRGVRIEPGEIEAALAAHPEVREALVVPRQSGSGESMLVAYVVPRGEARDLSGPLRGFLAGRLPSAMIPTAFISLAALPVTAVGKVDLRALPLPAGVAGLGTGSDGALPRTEMERTIAAVWREVLGVEDVGIDRNFFELGGHSLLLARAQARLGEVLGRQIPLAEMFSHTTVSALAAHLSGTSAAAEPEETEIQDRAASRRAAMDRRRARTQRKGFS